MKAFLIVMFLICTAIGTGFYVLGKTDNATYWLVIAAIILISYHH